MRKAIPLMFLSLLVCGSGCSFLTETNPPEPWTQGRWKDVKADNAQRLDGEDHGTSTAGDYVTAVPRALWSGVEWSWNAMTGNLPIKSAKDLFATEADARRNAIYTLAENRWGRKEPYTKYYMHMAETDTDPSVRAAAIRVLNRARDAKAVPIFISAMNDPEMGVRLEAAKALANIPDSRAVPALLKAMANEQENVDIRIASTDALREYKTSDVAQALIRVLSDRNFGVAWQARQSLNLMTGQDYVYNQAAWLEYLTGPAKPFG